ncbi:MAG: hypothetical protein GEU80_10495 [Dehalococcoidia bacterium]|nr:hypothetical protein [Dehalococcoidia bacterium]
MAIWVGRYAMVGGEVREHGPWLVDRERRREDETVRLIVLAEPLDERSGEFCAEVAEAVAALFGREALSLTGGLLRSLQQAHTNLAEWNRRSLREHQVAVGLTCIAIREGVATIAQVGPGSVYVAGPEGLEKFVTDDLPAAAPLGGPEPVEPAFHAADLDKQQLLLLTSDVEGAIGAGAIGHSLAAGPERALAELFVRTRQLSDMTAVLIADLDIDEDEEPPPPIETWDEDEEVEGRRVILGEAPSVAPAPVEGTPSPVRRMAPAGPAPRERPSEERRPPSPMPQIRRPPRVVGHRAPGMPTGLPWRWLAGALAVLLALAAAVWLVVPGLLSEDREAQLTDALGRAEGFLSVAEGTVDPAQERQALTSALAAIEEARAIDAEDPRVAPLQAEAQSLVAVLDAVVEVADLREVITFEGRITAPLTPAAVVYGRGDLWMLDGERGRVFRIPEGGGDPTEVYRTGERYEETEAREPLAITWESTSGRLLVLDTARTLFAIDPEAPQPTVLTLRDAEEMTSVGAMAAYVGNLYILDAEAGEVWRYLQAGNGFDSERSGLLGGIDLAGASALGVDGDIYVLDEGVLRRFRLAQEQEPLLRGIDTPPESAAGLVEDAARGRIYIADRGNERVVAGNREGPFLAQFLHPEFLDLRGITLSADGSTAYVLTGSGIYAFDPLQEPPAAAAQP